MMLVEAVLLTLVSCGWISTQQKVHVVSYHLLIHVCIKLAHRLSTPPQTTADDGASQLSQAMPQPLTPAEQAISCDTDARFN